MAINNEEKKNNRVPASEMPRASLEEVVTLAEALRDNFAGKNATPINLAKAIDRSPTSSSWRYLTGSAVAYGLLDGGYGANYISLTDLGRQIVSPTEEGLKGVGLLTALLRPAVLKAFYEKFDGAKVPKDDIAQNILETLGVPKDRTKESLKIIIDNAKYLGILTDVGNGQYIQLQGASAIRPSDPQGRQPSTFSQTLVSPPRKESKNIWDDFHIPIVEDKMYIEVPEAVYKRSFLDDELNDDLRALIKQAFTFAKKYIPKEEPSDTEKPDGG